MFVMAFAISVVGYAQNFESRIPNSSDLVVGVNGDNLLELLSLEEFNDYAIAKELFKEFNRDGTISKIQDFGVNLDSKAYYFLERKDKVTYHNIWIALEDQQKFMSLFSNDKKEKIVTTNGVSHLSKDELYWLWNDNSLLFTVAMLDDDYFDDEETYNTAKVELLDEAEVVEIEEVVETAVDATEEVEETVIESTEEVEIVEETVEPKANNNYYNDYNTKYTLKKIKGSQLALARGNMLFSGLIVKSILSNSEYTGTREKKAAASVWIKNYGESMTKLISGMGLYRKVLGADLGNAVNKYGIEAMSGSLFFEKDEVRLATSATISKEWQPIFKSIYNKKMGSKFFKYFNENQALAYFSTAINTTAVLEEYPDMMADIYGGIAPKYAEEIELMSEFLKIALDEEAIGELITGEALFVLTDIKEKEITYQGYEYDADYNRTEVTKTKSELRPEFIAMIGSKKKNLLVKLAKLGVKHNILEGFGSYFKVNIPEKELLDIYLTVKDDILFVTTSETQVKQIITGTMLSSSGVHKNTIRKNSTVAFVNGKKILEKLPEEEFSRKSEREIFSFANKHVSTMQITVGKFKGNKMTSEIVLDTPMAKENSFKYIFDVIEELVKL